MFVYCHVCDFEVACYYGSRSVTIVGLLDCVLGLFPLQHCLEPALAHPERWATTEHRLLS